jgi:hypothetical protein
MKGTLFGLVCLLILGGCRPREATITIGDEDRFPVSFQPVWQGHRSILEPGAYVARTDEEWAVLRAELSGTAQPPALSLDGTMLLAVVDAGTTGGHTLEIILADRSADTLYVTYELGIPGQDCNAIQALEQPFHVVRIPATALPIQTIRKTLTLRCTQWGGLR